MPRLVKPIFLTLFVTNLLLFFYFLNWQTFPKVLVVINLVSIFVTLGLFVKPKKVNRDTLICLGMFLLAFFLRLYRIDSITPGIYGDEVTVAQTSQSILQSPLFTPFVPVNYGHATPLLYLTGLSISWFGRNLAAIRLVSVVFGAANVAIFYLLARKFFPALISMLTTFLFLFSYSHIIVSRFAYEMTPAIFFQLLSYLFLYQIYKSKKTIYLIPLGVTIGLGLFTYLGFRTTAVSLIAVALLLIIKSLPQKIMGLFYLLAGIFIASNTLIAYSLKHPDEVWARAKSVSVFHQNLPKQEVIKELKGSVKRTLGMFFFYGDPNPRQNPSQKPVFDWATSVIAIFGLIHLRKKRWLLTAGLFLMLPGFVNDLLTLERIPEFHYYGLGHPNVLRVSGLIPVIYFLVGWGLKYLRSKLSLVFSSANLPYILASLVIFISTINLNWYFNQPISPFNFYVNGAEMLDISKYINQSGQTTVYVSNKIYEDQRIQYFLNPQIKLQPLTATSIESIPDMSLSLLYPSDNIDLTKVIIEQYQQKTLNFSVVPFADPWKNIYALAMQN